MTRYAGWSGMLLGWVLADGSLVCAECDDGFEHEDWTPVYQGGDEAEGVCSECGAEFVGATRKARAGVRDTDDVPPDTRRACAQCEAPEVSNGLCAAHLADSCLTP